MVTERVISGMRPTGRLHLGHYHGVLKNWLTLQHEKESLFFVADWHALTTHYDEQETITQSTWDMIVDWLAVGIDPTCATLFIQSRVPEHAELFTLLSMITPISWLERVPSYKDQQMKLPQKDLATYGFLGYPLLQSADILLYKATEVPVGEDQVPHIEFTREIARRFNHLYGKEPEFEEKVRVAIKKLGNKKSALYQALRNRYQETGEESALESARILLEDQHSLSLGDIERLSGYLEGTGKIILVEPDGLLAPSAKLPGLDGKKMSKSYKNTIELREPIESITKKLKTMPTDPSRVRRTDPGEPDNCPVWQFHDIYSDDTVKSWVQSGCRSAGIGCVECKEPLIKSITQEIQPIQERIAEYDADFMTIKNIVMNGCEQARKIARETLREVREVMGLT